jgi:FMN phosphatase YigB (HAD superfamily)
MRIGFDFDNTIVSYDALFHKVAVEQGVIHEEVPVNKLAVRDFLRKAGQEDIWTEMQGYVYGARMSEAQSYPEVIAVMKRLRDAGHTLAIMSHKTRHPYRGKQYDLHAAARDWIQRYLCVEGAALIPSNQIFFELTKEEKLARIGNFGCDVFIDDLPEILLAEQFPAATKRYLFDPEQHHRQANLPDIHIVPSWVTFESHLT